MVRWIASAGLAALVLAPPSFARAQDVPLPLLNPIPAPLPPPPEPPVINGPLPQSRARTRIPPPTPMEIFPDRVARCLDQSAHAARTASGRDAYVRACINAR